MLQREQRVEAERLGEVTELKMLVDDGRVGAARLTEHVERDADLDAACCENCDAEMPGGKLPPIERQNAAGSFTY
jgi:hypothetical protein